jgi:hypothetical protein
MELYLDCTNDSCDGAENPPDERGEGSLPGSTAKELGISDVLGKLEVEVEAVE